jgi:hypothetical protein
MVLHQLSNWSFALQFLQMAVLHLPSQQEMEISRQN